MRLFTLIASVVLLFVSSCADDAPVYRISGSGTAPGDTLYLYGLDRRYEYVDTIIADEAGRFEYAIYADTLFPMNMIMPTGKQILLYAEPNLSAEIVPDTLRRGNWRVSGGAVQQLYDSMATRLDAMADIRRFEEVKNFVASNPLNEVGVMLMRHYLVEAREPSARHIREVLNLMGGRLQDNDYIIDYRKMMDERGAVSNSMYSALPAFSYMTVDSIRVNNSRYRDKFTVLTFWASWDSVSREHIKKVSQVAREYKKDELMFLNISLDYDTAAWHTVLRADSIIGDNVCDLKMWSNTLVDRYNVSRIPYSVLVNPQLLNVGFGIPADSLKSKADSVMTEHKNNALKIKKNRKKR